MTEVLSLLHEVLLMGETVRAIASTPQGPLGLEQSVRMSHLLVGPSDFPRFCFRADEAQGRGIIDICSYGGRPSFTEALSP